MDAPSRTCFPKMLSDPEVLGLDTSKTRHSFSSSMAPISVFEGKAMPTPLSGGRGPSQGRLPPRPPLARTPVLRSGQRALSSPLTKCFLASLLLLAANGPPQLIRLFLPAKTHLASLWLPWGRILDLSEGLFERFSTEQRLTRTEA